MGRKSRTGVSTTTNEVALASKQVLTLYDPTKYHEVYTDAKPAFFIAGYALKLPLSHFLTSFRYFFIILLVF